MMSRDVEVDLLLETGGGGAARHVLDLHKELRKLGWKSNLLISIRRADKLFLQELSDISPEEISYFDLHRSPHSSDINAVWQLRRRFKQSSNRHILHAHSTKAAILGWAAGRFAEASVLTPHAYRGMDRTLTGSASFLVRKSEAIFSKAFNKVIAVSPDELRYVSSLGVADNHSCYIPNGVDTAAIRNRMRRQALTSSQKGNVPVIGFVGRLVYQKNPSLFLEVLKVLVEKNIVFRAVIVGDGPLRTTLAELASEYGLAHHIIWKEDTSAIEELNHMDVLVHTSHYESLPYTLLEAAAAEVPIVSVRNSGSEAIFRELVPSVIVETSQPCSLADAVTRILINPDVRANHIKALHTVAKRFTIQKMAESTIAVYEEVLSNASKRVLF